MGSSVINAEKFYDEVGFDAEKDLDKFF